MSFIGWEGIGPQCLSWGTGFKQSTNSSSMVTSHCGGDFALCRKWHFLIWLIILVIREQRLCQINGKSAFQVGSCAPTHPPPVLIRHTHAQSQGVVQAPGIFREGQRKGSLWWSLTFNSGLKMLLIWLKHQVGIEERNTYVLPSTEFHLGLERKKKETVFYFK